MRTVWKYDVPIDAQVRLALPDGAEVIHVGYQGGDVITFWALVDTKAPKTVREFTVVGTGHVVTSSTLKYRGTTQAGMFVWHLFEEAQS